MSTINISQTVSATVAGCDFGVPRRAGDQRKKIVWIEAECLGRNYYRVTVTGRNRRLIDAMNAGPLDHLACQKRPGWTLPELTAELCRSPPLHVIAFDFPFSIPYELLNSQVFAERVQTAPFRTRQQWSQFVASHLRMEFDSPRVSGEMRSFDFFEPWRRTSEFWVPRATDLVARASPPLKHIGQSVFNMTLGGAAMLYQLEKVGYQICLNTLPTRDKPSVFETYPREITKRMGFRGSYKQDPAGAIDAALGYLDQLKIRFECSESVMHFCKHYRSDSLKIDPDGSDALLCLISAIAAHAQQLEMMHGDAIGKKLKEEGAIMVPRFP